jgi:hypothetical protein
MTLEKALELCKMGLRITRSSWNGKDQFVYYQPGSIVAREDIRNTSILKWAMEQNISGASILGHFDFKKSNNNIQCGWLASLEDMKADDWEVVTQDRDDHLYWDSVEFTLTLPGADIGDIYFNEQKAHAFFARQYEGWWQSVDILFLSARNFEDSNSRDILKEYLNDSRIKQQIAKLFNLPPAAVTVELPQENQGIMKYHGAQCCYWLADSYPGCAEGFCHVNKYGAYQGRSASEVCGCAPSFHIEQVVDEKGD